MQKLKIKTHFFKSFRERIVLVSLFVLPLSFSVAALSCLSDKKSFLDEFNDATLSEKEIAASQKILLSNLKKEITAKKDLVKKRETNPQVIDNYNYAFDYIETQVKKIANDLAKLFLIIDKQNSEFLDLYIHEIKNYGLDVVEDGRTTIASYLKSLKYTKKMQKGMEDISIILNKINLIILNLKKTNSKIVTSKASTTKSYEKISYLYDLYFKMLPNKTKSAKQASIFEKITANIFKNKQTKTYWEKIITILKV